MSGSADRAQFHAEWSEKDGGFMGRMKNCPLPWIADSEEEDMKGIRRFSEEFPNHSEILGRIVEDREEGCSYLKISEKKIAETVELTPSLVLLDMAEDGSVVGVEFLS